MVDVDSVGCRHSFGIALCFFRLLSLTERGSSLWELGGNIQTLTTKPPSHGAPTTYRPSSTQSPLKITSTNLCFQSPLFLRPRIFLASYPLPRCYCSTTLLRTDLFKRPYSPTTRCNRRHGRSCNSEPSCQIGIQVSQEEEGEGPIR